MLYTIENDYLKIVVSTLGATLNKFIVKKNNTDIVLGFDNESDYLMHKGAYLGATVARNANRIENSEFLLNDKKYQLLKNDGNNNLHSGIGVSFSEFKLSYLDKNSLTFSILLEDGRDGFPGNLNLEVTYRLIDNKLQIEFNGISDADTIFNVTNHSYFNLDKDKKTIFNHKLKLFTDKVSINNPECLPYEKIRDVKNTSFDFIEYKTIGENLKINDDNLSNGGIDHCYITEDLNYKQIVSLKNDHLELDVFSDLPNFHIYSGNCLGDLNGKCNNEYHNYYGLAIEPEFFPNSINYKSFLKPILKANTNIRHIIDYVIKEID